MGEHILEKAMLDFMAHKADVLLSTTIVENGIDIPNANTIIINRADRYGLSQLYQLRGRVGRSDRPAYAYLLIPPEESLSPVARKRLAAIKEFSDLGSGFRVAALDLEIRGAGNLLGGEQSGQIDAVGFEMYMKLLEETIRELKGEDLEDDLRATVNLRIDFRIEDSYVPDMNQRLMIYRRIAAARSEDELTRIMEEVRDRYGPPPVPVLNLADYGRIRVLADELGIESIEREGTVDRDPLPREGEGRSDPRDRPGPRARRPAADPAGDAEAGSARSPATAPHAADPRLKQAAEAAASRGRTGTVAARPSSQAAARAGLVDGPGDGRRGDPRVLEGGDSEAEGGGSPRPGGILERVTELLEDLRD